MGMIVVNESGDRVLVMWPWQRSPQWVVGQRGER